MQDREPHLRDLLPVVILGVELDHVAVHHLSDLPRAVPIAPPHAITANGQRERKAQMPPHGQSQTNQGREKKTRG